MPRTRRHGAVPDLLPCPFCGGEAQFVMESDWLVPGEVMVTAWKVECSRCWASPKPNNYEGDKRLAAERWNRRAERECRDVSRREFFRCSWCGHSLEVQYDDSDLYDGDCVAGCFGYCPYCGARVEDGGDGDE